MGKEKQILYRIREIILFPKDVGTYEHACKAFTKRVEERDKVVPFTHATKEVIREGKEVIYRHGDGRITRVTLLIKE